MGRNAELNKVGFMLSALAPVIGWLAAAKKNNLAEITQPKIKGFVHLVPQTFEHPVLYLSAGGAFLVSIVLWIILVKFNSPDFRGYKYDYRLRGSDIVSSEALNRLTTNKKIKQVTLATVKMPVDIENLQTLIVGATGSAKTLILTQAMYSILLRGDRQVIVDPDGYFTSLFYKPGDVLLNPHDERTPGWVIFNEMKESYDYETYSYSLVPLGKSSTEEEWNGYGRLLVTEVFKKLHSQGINDFTQLYYWCVNAPEEDLEAFCNGTLAQSLFVGTDRTLGSARFVLTNKLSAHMIMPGGSFSIRDYLADPKGGNIFITWREDQIATLKPLISTWVDVICNAILSLPEVDAENIWLHTDELASLDKIKALEPALTKGRKKKLRIISCVQAISQLEEIWGEKGSVTLRSCYRNLIALGGARSDDRTPEVLSRALGDFDVVRKRETNSRNSGGGSSSSNAEGKDQDYVVKASEISNLPDREGYVAFTRGFPIAKVKVPIVNFKARNPAYIPRSSLGG
ncbi:type IV secretion system DNA-binding domain-containing protein [Salmonella enterica]|nr:type IV secretion system DNA-binding domain-containig protein [Salmonella enterica]EEP3373006.1 type IV secretion system DNA-binding domain-containing protein [Salmonella enterica]EFP6579713.1 type IV secretion system DNA-binding domain-containing protein [Salmonella enterica]EGC7970996.1 type IV secretion system DNA-binding domain-containing protein [Salmonella enterica]EIV4461173.1 type IV secretion system DNA-binding domain-containing protein [Salmonella enterica]